MKKKQNTKKQAFPQTPIERRSFLRKGLYGFLGLCFITAAGDVPKRLFLPSRPKKPAKPQDIFLSKLITQKQFTIFGESPHHVKNFEFLADKLDALAQPGLSHAVIELDAVVERIVHKIEADPAAAKLIRGFCNSLANDPQEDSLIYCHSLLTLLEKFLYYGTKIHGFDRAPEVNKTATKQVLEDHLKVSSLLIHKRMREYEDFIESLDANRFEELKKYTETLIRQRNEEDPLLAQDILNAVGQERTLIVYGDSHAKHLALLLGPDNVTYVRMAINMEDEKRHAMKDKGTDVQRPDLIYYTESQQWALTDEGANKGYGRLFNQKTFPALQLIP